MKALLRGLLSGGSFAISMVYARMFFNYCKEPLEHFQELVTGAYIMEPIPQASIISWFAIMALVFLAALVLRDIENSDS